MRLPLPLPLSSRCGLRCIVARAQPFGKALRPIPPGEWLVNQKALHALHGRGLATSVTHPNFVDYVKPAHLDEATFVPGEPLPLSRAGATFDGFVRGAGRDMAVLPEDMYGRRHSNRSLWYAAAIAATGPPGRRAQT